MDMDPIQRFVSERGGVVIDPMDLVHEPSSKAIVVLNRAFGGHVIWYVC